MKFSEIFESNGYLHLPNFLDKENCQQYVNEFKKLVDQGYARQDDQCPLSYSLGHTPLFDSLLEQLTPHMEQATGKKLYPTYAYARWYAPGDELKIHRDRPSCEISATITLGFQGNAWPINMGYDENKQNYRQINMQVGDSVVYKGEELYHWREKYTEGEWQAQVFIHYVDANGPNAEWKYDKRDSLAHHNNFNQEKQNTNSSKTDRDYLFLVQKNSFSQEQCQRIIKGIEKEHQDKFIDAETIGGLNKAQRDSKKILLSNNRNIAATLVGIGLGANQFKWKFNVTHSEQTEYLKYDKNGHFSEHIDTILNERNDSTRKLTVLAILNNDFEGGKFYLRDGKCKIYPDQEPGNVIIFPSFLNHGVEPVQSGIRRTIVSWLLGPYFK